MSVASFLKALVLFIPRDSIRRVTRSTARLGGGWKEAGSLTQLRQQLSAVGKRPAKAFEKDEMSRIADISPQFSETLYRDRKTLYRAVAASVSKLNANANIISFKKDLFLGLFAPSCFSNL